jgi:hypothetical protein
MTTNLLESIAGQLTPKMIQRVSTLMGETPAHTQKAVDGVMPTVLAGVMHFSSSGGGAAQLVDVLTRGDYGNVLNNLTGLLDGGNTAERMMGSGRNILSMMFANKLPAVSELIMTYGGIKNTSALSLLSLAAPVVLGVIARTRAVQGLSAEGLTTLLLDQKKDILRLSPPGLTSILGLNSGTDLGAGFASTATGMAPNEKLWAAWEQRGKDSGRPPWGWLLIGIVALSAVVYWVWGRETGMTPLRASTPPQMSALALELLPTIPTVSLPDGTVLSLTTTGYGQENLFATNEAGDGRVTNHRPELVEKK